nr:MAG: maturation protein [Leviviridae sp.]
MAIARYRSKGSYDPPNQQIGLNYVLDWSKYPNISWILVPPGVKWHSWGETGVPLDVRQCWDELHKLTGRKGVSPRYKGKKPRKPRTPIYAEGGPLYLKSLTSVRMRGLTHGFINTSAHGYNGEFIINLQKDQTVTDDYVTNYANTVGNYGANAWSRMRPVSPKAGLGQFLGELRDVPSIGWTIANPASWWNAVQNLRGALAFFKGLGSDYLNYQFGWKPFIGDLIKAYNLQKNIEKRIAFIRKNNGKWIRRAGTIKYETSMERVTGTGHIITPVLPSPFYQGFVANQTYEKIITLTDKIWYEGMMKYYIPQLNVDRAEDVWSSPLLRKLYGLELTPSLLWELMPWSWLMDWFASYGTVIDNIVNYAYDQLTAKYAYVMRTRIRTVKYKQKQFYFTLNKGIISVEPEVTFEACCKERAESTPFGFGLSEDSFTSRQWAILAALGITRLR